MDLCNINHIKPLLARHGFHFQKSLGQNFLCDPAVPRAIADNAGIGADTAVLEVGPGIGALSRELCARARTVVAVELDRRLPEVLRETMADCRNFSLVQGDILKTDLPALCDERFGPGDAVCCANLPFYITTPALEKLLSCGRFRTMTVLVQREVADRLAARPGTPDNGAFTLWLQYHARPEIVMNVPRDRFIPAPNVDSAVVRLDRLAAPPVPGDEDRLFRLVRAAFAQRRKTLLNALSAAYGDKISKADLADLLKSLNIPENIRGEALTLTDFSRLSLTLDNYLAKR